MTVPLSVVLNLLLEQEEARGARLRRGPPAREGPPVMAATQAEAFTASAQATDTDQTGPRPKGLVVRS